jgi:hypothetical protein
MTFWSDMDSEMQLLPLDTDTADRLLAGSVDAEDAPPGYGRVVRLLEAASAEASSEELAREPETVAVMKAALRSPVHGNAASSRRSFMPFALSRPRLTAAVVAAAFAASVGMASAGSLPGAAQDVASEMLAKVGITVPGANDSAGTHPDVRGNSTSVPIAPADSGKGAEISELATTTDLTGVEKGAAVSTAASEGKSQAGQHGSASGAGSASTTAAPVETPNSGGTGTADTASGGKSSTGTATANAASGGKSAGGSGNASDGQETADTASGGRSSTGQSHRP